jgi:translation initiation factor IF-3
MFRGREQAHPERGRALLKRLFEDLGDQAVIEQQPQQEGRNMHMLVAPTREAIAAGEAAKGPKSGDDSEESSSDGSTEAAA